MWVQSNVTIPRTIDDAAVGFYDDEIYIFGGWIDPRQIIRYNVARNVFIDDGTELLSVDTDSRAQFYEQSANTMYFINGDTFSIYNFVTKQFTDNWNNFQTPVSVNGFSCLSATDEYLFVVGGRSIDNVPLNAVQILHLLSTEWIVSYMNTERSSLSCAIDRDRSALYAIGGWTNVDSIEMLNITDIELQFWVNLDETLAIGLHGTRALLHQKTNRIFIIGGSDGNKAYEYTHIINTITNEVTLSSDPLPYEVSTTAALIVDNIMYGFGGFHPNRNPSVFNTWFFYALSTESPTFEPTEISNEPTMAPSYLPSAQPSASPSDAPSNNPSAQPSDAPNASSASPTAPPSYRATAQPHRNPTLYINPPPTTAPVVATTNHYLSTTVNINDNNPSTDLNEKSTDWLLYIEIAVIFLLVVIISVFIIYAMKYHKSHTETNDTNVKNMAPNLQMSPVQNKLERKVHHKAMAIDLQKTTAGSGGVDTDVINAQLVIKGSAKVTARPSMMKIDDEESASHESLYAPNNAQNTTTKGTSTGGADSDDPSNDPQEIEGCDAAMKYTAEGGEPSDI